MLDKATPTESVVSRPPPVSCLSIHIESPLLSLFSNYAKKLFSNSLISGTATCVHAKEPFSKAFQDREKPQTPKEEAKLSI